MRSEAAVVFLGTWHTTEALHGEPGDCWECLVEWEDGTIPRRAVRVQISYHNSDEKAVFHMRGFMKTVQRFIELLVKHI